MRRVGLIFGGLALLALVLVWYYRMPTTTPSSPEDTTTSVSKASSFEECAALYPVMESYPEQCITPDGTTFTRYIGNELDLNDHIVITTPRPGDVVRSPLSVEGEARGPWFFEASFLVRLEDSQGNQLGQGIAQALGEWMTTDFVPFSTSLTWETPQTATGTLLLIEEDPSGLKTPRILRVPIRFAE